MSGVAFQKSKINMRPNKNVIYQYLKILLYYVHIIFCVLSVKNGKIDTTHILGIYYYYYSA